MRELILKRIEGIRSLEKGFSPEIQRWKNFTFNDLHGSEVSASKLAELSDQSVMIFYERVIRNYYKKG